VGEVVEVGSEVRGFRVGDRVLAAGVVGCGRCRECLGGHVTRCLTAPASVFGVSPALPGGQAEAVAVPAADHALYRIPDGVSVEQAVLLTDILPTGHFGAANAEIAPGQDVAVIGMGPVGVMALLCAQLRGAARVFALDRVPERLAAAEALGAIPVDASGDAETAVREATGGHGVDAVVEAVGLDDTIRLALTLARAGGVVSVVGVNVNLDFSFPMGLALLKGLTFRIGVCPVPETWPALVPLVQAGRIAPERVFTHRMPLSEGARAYQLFDRREDGVLKVLLDPSQ
jgi:threonine dehydrogenase-like Zn-dependent dehydrogenase